MPSRDDAYFDSNGATAEETLKRAQDKGSQANQAWKEVPLLGADSSDESG